MSKKKPGPGCVPEAISMHGTGKTTESDGGQFPSHPGRPGPETSSKGAHLTPNPQEMQAGFTALLQPSIHGPASRQKSRVNLKHLYGQGPIRGPPFPEPAQMKFYSLHEKITGGGRVEKQKIKQSKHSGKIKKERRWGARSWSSEISPAFHCVFIRREYYVRYGSESWLWSLIKTTVCFQLLLLQDSQRNHG